MASRPKLRLSRLRDIGWRWWDPIGLNHIEGGWENSRAANEYDSYLIEAAVLVSRDADNEAVARLVWGESEHMGMGVRDDTYERARRTVAAMRSDPDLWSGG
jgi:hypothetical protein